jgi:integrase
MKLTARNVALALAKGEAERIVFDDEIPGLGVRMRAGGSCNWVFQYKIGTKHRRMSIGAVSAISVADAKKQAGKLHAQVKLGNDPAGVKAENRARASETFEEVAKLFLAAKRKKLKARTCADLERYLLCDAKSLHGLALAGIKQHNISKLLSEAPSRNHLRAWLSAMFSWAMGEGLIEANPVTGTNKDEAKARVRVLSESELREVWAALQGDGYGDIVRLLMLTGQRRDEIGALRWFEIDFDRSVIVLPTTRTKNKREHVVPLSDAARDILKGRHHVVDRDLVFGQGDGGFSGWSKCKERLDNRILAARKAAHGKGAQPMPDWRLHDIRRSVATGMGSIGVQPHIIEAVLNHVSGHKAGVAGVYNLATYEPEKDAALARWAEHLEAVVTGTAADVVPPLAGIR